MWNIEAIHHFTSRNWCNKQCATLSKITISFQQCFNHNYFEYNHLLWEIETLSVDEKYCEKLNILQEGGTEKERRQSAADSEPESRGVFHEENLGKNLS